MFNIPAVIAFYAILRQLSKVTIRGIALFRSTGPSPFQQNLAHILTIHLLEKLEVFTDFFISPLTAKSNFDVDFTARQPKSGTLVGRPSFEIHRLMATLC